MPRHRSSQTLEAATRPAYTTNVGLSGLQQRKRGGDTMPERVAGHLTEERIREILEEYRAAYERRDRAAVFDWDLRDASTYGDNSRTRPRLSEVS